MARQGLDLNELTKRPAVQMVLETAKSLSSLPINIRCTSEWRPTHPDHPLSLPGPMMYPTGQSFDVYLNETLPEQMVVHELLHVVLIHESYPEIRFDASRAPNNAQERERFKSFADRLVNKLQHPEIYRRMETEYHQEMAGYQAYVSAELLDLFKTNVNQGLLSYPLGIQTSLADIIDLLYLQPGSHTALDGYRAALPAAFDAAVSLKEELDRITFRTPPEALSCVNLFNTHSYRFGKAIGVGVDNDLWLALEWFLPKN
jgi:hypothetical protein